MSPAHEHTEDGLSRRGFAQLVAAVAAGVALPAAAAGAGPDDPPKPVKPEITREQAIETLIRQRFGKHLTDDQVRKLTQRVANLSRTGDALKRVPLTNADEPAVIFRAD
jgi:parvulin-like peptidyl-prolyl isomerase